MKPDEWVAYHRSGRCRDSDHRAIITQELEHGLPADPFVRMEWYATQRKKYAAWREAIDQHQWSFQNGSCLHCQSHGLMLTAGEQQVCFDHCLNTLIPWYPTGHTHPSRVDLLLHQQLCTSHWLCPTSSFTEYLETALGSSNLQTGPETSNFTSSSNDPRPNPTTSSSGSPLRASDLLLLKSRPFGIPKR